MLQVQNKFKKVRKEFNAHVNRTANEVLRLPALRLPETNGFVLTLGNLFVISDTWRIHVEY